MAVSDYLVRIITKNANVRALSCVTTELVKQACRRHKTTPTASAALGRVLTGAALMGALLKSRQRVVIRFDSDGPLKKIIAEATSSGEVRGYAARPDINLPLKDGKLDVAGAIGKDGTLTVIKDLRLREPYTGMVRIYTGEVAEDLAYYLTESEQIPSAVGLGVYVEPNGDIGAAGGFLIQSFPPQDRNLIERLISRIGEMPSLADLLKKGDTPEQLLERIFHDIPFEVLERRELVFKCSCSKERVEQALLSLGKEEIRRLIQEQGGAEAKCEFCREVYFFDRTELEEILKELESPRH